MLDPISVRNMTTGAFMAGMGAEFVKGRVLDVGCGHQPYRACFPDAEWVGLDVRPVGELVADAHALPCEDASFDTVLATDVLHLCSAPPLVFREAARVLKPGGHLLVSAPNCRPEDGEGFWGFGVRGLHLLAEGAGLTVLMSGADGKTLTPEFSAFSNVDKYGFAGPGNIGAWIDQMDHRYPSCSLMVARKEGDVTCQD